VEKLLEDTLIKLSVVVSEPGSPDGRSWPRWSPASATRACWPICARGALRSKTARLTEALTGRFHRPPRVPAGAHAAPIDAITADIAAVQERIDAEIAPFAQAVARLDAMPGVRVTAARTILAEVGLDMARFPTAAHLAFLGPVRARGQ
jgi:transposase